MGEPGGGSFAIFTRKYLLPVPETGSGRISAGINSSTQFPCLPIQTHTHTVDSSQTFWSSVFFYSNTTRRKKKETSREENPSKANQHRALFNSSSRQLEGVLYSKSIDFWNLSIYVQLVPGRLFRTQWSPGTRSAKWNGKRGGNGLSVFGELWGAVIRGKEGFKKMFLFMVKEECSN